MMHLWLRMKTEINRPCPSNQALDQIGAFIKGSKASPFQHFVESWQSYFALSAFSEIASPGSCPKIRSCQTGFGRGTLGLGSWHM